MSTNVDQYGSVTCDITVDGRKAAVSFANGEVTLSVAATAGEILFQVPFAMVPQAVSG